MLEDADSAEPPAASRRNFCLFMEEYLIESGNFVIWFYRLESADTRIIFNGSPMELFAVFGRHTNQERTFCNRKV